MKYRIVTKSGKHGGTVYWIQCTCNNMYWGDINYYTNLEDAKNHMRILIEQRDFKSEVIVSE